MKKFCPFAIILSACLFAQTFALSGKVIDHRSNPVPNARITLGSSVAFTDSTGIFEFPLYSEVSHLRENHQQKVRIHRNSITIPTIASERVVLSCYSFSGRRLFKRSIRATGNSTTISIPSEKIGGGMFLVRLSSRFSNLTAKFMPLTGIISTNQMMVSRPITTGSQLNQDSIKAEKFGYIKEIHPVPTADQMDDIILEPDSIEGIIDSLIAIMTLDEKVGQMTQAERGSLEENEIQDLFLGSILSGGGSAPGDTPESWADMYDQMQNAALSTRLGIPIIYGSDAVHGHNNLPGAVIFPHNIGLGCTRNPGLIREAGRITAIETAATGVDWTFAPCLAVVRDDRWGRTYESFGEDPELQQRFAADAVYGYQGDDLGADTTIAACAKHYVADGGTAYGTSNYTTGWPVTFEYLVDRGDAQISEDELREIHMPGYVEAVRAGVATIMASYSSWNGQKLHGHSYLITDVLKTELGFNGFVVSDWDGIDEISEDYSTCVEQAINAGIDMVMAPNSFADFIHELKNHVNDGRVPQERIDDAVRRILRVKYHLGLFDAPLTDRSLISRIGSQQHREVARECVRQSQVLLKNESSTLPLSKAENSIVVIGEHADDIGNQCGGWTISWQGSSGPITSGTTILQGIEQAVENHSMVSYSRDGDNLPDADIAVIVFGETPYAEGYGDQENLQLPSISYVQSIVSGCKEAGMKTVGVLISGRPVDISTVIDSFDAFVAAWLPGTEGGGVADVLFDDYTPTGKLSVSWPADSQPVNRGDADYQPLFHYGFGLTY